MSTGSIYLVSAAMQNSCTTQYRASIPTVPGTKVVIYFLTLQGLMCSASAEIVHFDTDDNGATVGVHISGKGTYAKSGKPAVSGQYLIHAWKDKTGGWLQGEIWNDAHTELLWATGDKWPADVPSAVKCPMLTLHAPT